MLKVACVCVINQLRCGVHLSVVPLQMAHYPAVQPPSLQPVLTVSVENCMLGNYPSDHPNAANSSLWLIMPPHSRGLNINLGVWCRSCDFMT